LPKLEFHREGAETRRKAFSMKFAFPPRLRIFAVTTALSDTTAFTAEAQSTRRKSLFNLIRFL